MDKIHAILIILLGILLVVFLLQKNDNNEYKKDIEILEAERKVHLKQIYNNNETIKDLINEVEYRDTLISLINVNRKNENEAYHKKVNTMRFAPDSIIWSFLTDRHVKDSTKGLRY